MDILVPWQQHNLWYAVVVEQLYIRAWTVDGNIALPLVGSHNHKKWNMADIIMWVFLITMLSTLH